MKVTKQEANKKYYKSPKGKAKRKEWLKTAFGCYSMLNADLKSRYDGFDLSAWEAMFRQQGYCCGVCSSTNPGSKNGWNVHHTGSKKLGTLRVHAILCKECNREARDGSLDRILHLRRLADKLEKWL